MITTTRNESDHEVLAMLLGNKPLHECSQREINDSTRVLRAKYGWNCARVAAAGAGYNASRPVVRSLMGLAAR